MGDLAEKETLVFSAFWELAFCRFLTFFFTFLHVVQNNVRRFAMPKVFVDVLDMHCMHPTTLIQVFLRMHELQKTLQIPSTLVLDTRCKCSILSLGLVFVVFDQSFFDPFLTGHLHETPPIERGFNVEKCKNRYSGLGLFFCLSTVV